MLVLDEAVMTVMIRIIWGKEEEEEEDRQLDSPSTN
jgi:hypothetical protein